MKLYICRHCGNVISYEKKVGADVVCCGEVMTELIPSQTDGASEKHTPVIKKEGSKVVVQVGEIEHPMTEEHYIEWIVIETSKGIQRVNLSPFDLPKAEFILSDDDIICAYAYCNLHGFWKSI